MRKIKTIWVCFLLVILSTSPLMLSGYAAADNNDNKNIDAAIVLDNSGSMSEYINSTSYDTKWDKAVEASNEFVNNMKKEDKASLFCFGDPDNSSYPNQYVGPVKKRALTYTNKEGKTELKNSIENLMPESSDTPLFDTIGYSMDDTVENKRSSSLGVVIALTDGLDNENYKFYPSHDYRERKYVDKVGGYRYGLLNSEQLTFIIGLDLDSNVYSNQLENVSKTSGGNYYSTENASELDDVYDDIEDEIDEKISGDESNLLLYLGILGLIGAITAIIIAAVVKRNNRGYPRGAPGQQYQPRGQQPQQGNSPPNNQRGDQQYQPRGQQPQKSQGERPRQNNEQN